MGPCNNKFFLPFLNSRKDLEPSYKMDLDLWDCFGWKKTLSYIRRIVLVIKIEKFQSDNGETLGTSIFSLFLFFL